MRYGLFFTFLLYFPIDFLLGQDATFTLKIVSTDQPTFTQQYEFQDTSNLYTSLNIFLDSLHQAAYLSASIDKIVKEKETYTASVFLGAQYNDFEIGNGNIDDFILKKVGLERFLERPINYPQLQNLQEKIVAYLENNGYPFAAVQLKNVQIMEQKVIGLLFLTKGKRIQWGRVKIEGEGQLSTAYLENYLGLKKGNVYQKNKLLAASDRIAELPFMEENRTPSVLFKGNEATVNLFLTPKKANRFDFLIGVLPNNQETGKVLITGNLEADFYNQFGKGERIYLEFEQLRPETQQLQITTNYPYLLATPLGIDFELGLYKRDSTYRDLIWNIGLQYLFEGGNYLKAFSKNTSSALLAIDENAIIRNRTLPANLDIRNTAFGLAYQLEKLDYRFNPRRGWLLQLEGNAGIKTIQKNNKITDLVDESSPSFDFNQLYDALDLTTFQYQLIGRVDKYFPIRKRSTLKASVQGGTTISENPILRNEQFRIGGNQLLRGFDEESIFATSYLLGTLEYRYLIGQNGYFSLFGDMAYITNKTKETDFSNRPTGIGAGMTFETKAGLFGISYALGKLENTAFEFRTAKVHFGFVNLF